MISLSLSFHWDSIQLSKYRTIRSSNFSWDDSSSTGLYDTLLCNARFSRCQNYIVLLKLRIKMKWAYFHEITIVICCIVWEQNEIVKRFLNLRKTTYVHWLTFTSLDLNLCILSYQSYSTTYNNEKFKEFCSLNTKFCEIRLS